MNKMENAIRWVAGFGVGAVWSYANLFFTINIFKIGILKKDPRKLTALLLLKFPVLYLLGFLILTSKAFPAMSIFTGLVAGAITMGMLKLWPRQA